MQHQSAATKPMSNGCRQTDATAAPARTTAIDQAAKALGVSRFALYRLLKKHGLRT